jgi:NHS family xanthosine MFS transporter
VDYQSNRNKATEGQFYIAGGVAILLGLYALTLPKCPPQKLIDKNAPLSEQLGLNAFKLFGIIKWHCSSCFLCF